MPLIYKYRSWTLDHHADCLLKNELYFTSPKQINDPFDFKIPYDYSLLVSEEEKHEFIDWSISNFSPELVVDTIAKYGSMANFRLYSFNFIKNFPDKHQEYMETKDFERNDNNFGVLSFSEIWYSVQMWSYYAQDHKGFCLGFDRASFAKLAHTELGLMMRVNYTGFPHIHPLEKDVDKLSKQKSHYKAPEWSTEREVRISVVSWPKPYTEKERKYYFDNSLLKEIILGLKISEKDKGEIIRNGVKRGLPIYQIEKVPLSFKITRRLLLQNDLEPYLK
jgi:Protein of unknown function (DUF2971)